MRDEIYKNDLKKKIKEQSMEYDTTKFKSAYYENTLEGLEKEKWDRENR